MKLSQFRFHLPPELIAGTPSKTRDEVNMMVLDRKTQKIEHRHFKDVLDYFGDGDVFIINNTKVFPARLIGKKKKTKFGEQVTCTCGRIFIHDPKSNKYRRALLEEV